MECDKNIGSALIEHTIYDNLVIQSLNCVTYKKLEYDPLVNIINTINNKLNELNFNGHISTTLLNLLLIKPNNNCKLGHYRLLPKLHKETFSCRPIINSINHPTSNLSLLINLLLQPHVQK